ncbi:hypothetical protein [Chelatococcus reniformis]|uniref:Sulfur globule protein n=1 Tax=Chelatococcus reniformis TaxID=1494448 RepID=A0A916UR36_9HYPH|nr:hypothetical protein [Chelatococcus reniformis]GGC83719.1 hypothetical protein GCM10010994_47010 [Chelatococcus reniformis]
MKRVVLAAVAAAGIVTLGAGFAPSARAAVAGPQPALAEAAPVEKAARVCGPYGCRWVPGPGYYGRRYYGPPPRYYGPRRYYGPPRAYGRPYGYRRYYGPRW